MRIDDFICLGRTVPEDSKKYGRKVCMAGYSDELRSFVRVYPLPVVTPIRQRSLCRLEVTRPNHDSRIESWRLARESDDFGIVEVADQIKIPDLVVRFEKSLSCSIAELNSKRLSLGVIRPCRIQPLFKSAGIVTDPDQKLLFESAADLFGEEATRLMPYIRFTDEGGSHELQVREWGCYEFLRKNPENTSALWEALRLGNDKNDYFFVVGNMCNRRNVWLIISIYQAAKHGPLFSGNVNSLTTCEEVAP